MNEKLKKFLMSLFMRSLCAGAIFLMLVILKRFVPTAFDYCSNVWTKSTNLGKVGRLLGDIAKEVIPF